MISNATLTLRGNTGSLEIRTTRNNKRFVALSVATTPVRRVSGQWKRSGATTWWHGAAYTGTLVQAVAAGEIQVGDLVEITGDAPQADFTDREGTKHSRVEIVVYEIKPVARKGESVAA